jgi:hypothetical protein
MAWVVPAAVVAFGAWLIHEERRRKVFVSYCHPEQVSYRNLFKAWHANAGLDFEFSLESPMSRIPGDDANVQRQLKAQIEAADCLLLLIGAETYGRAWVDWEVATAVKAGTKVIAVKLERWHVGPSSVYGVGAQWVYGFEHNKILKALKKT